MTRIRINTKPGCNYATVVTLDFDESLGAFARERRYPWNIGHPKSFQVLADFEQGREVGEDGRWNLFDTDQKWEALEEAVSFFLDSGFEVKARRERSEKWSTVLTLADLGELRTYRPETIED